MVTDATSGSASKAARALTGIVKAAPLIMCSLRMQAATAALHRGVVRGRGHLLVLHDDSHGLALRGSLMGLRQKSRELGSDSREPATGFAVVGFFQRCPNAIPVARRSTRLRRLPQAALCRSPRPAGFGDFFLCSIKSHPSFSMGERSSFVPTRLLHGSSQSSSS